MEYKRREKFLVFGMPFLKDDEIDEVIDTLKSSWIGTGPKTKLFESKFAQYVGSKYSVSLNSCTAALHLSLLSLGIGEGDEVITTPMSFCATSNTIIHSGAKPVFVDINKETFNIDEDLIEEKITTKTKAILIVHMAGRPCNMNKIMRIAKRHNVFVIEDAAHAIESFYEDQKIGNISDITCFSFYVNKNLTTSEGGMITTNNSSLAEKIRILSLHGMDNDAWKRFSSSGYKHYDVVYPGYKYNMTDIAASLGLKQLEKIDSMLKRREEIWDLYDNNLRDLPIILPSKFSGKGVHARHLYQILIDHKLTRDEVLQRLVEENIGTGVHYISIHLLKYYKERFGFKKEDFPNSSYVSDRTLSLPMTPYLTNEDVFDVINSLKKILS